MKPLTSTDILLIRIKGIFPFFTIFSVLQIVFTIMAQMGYLSWYIAILPYTIIVVYYLVYFIFIGLAKLIMKLLNRYADNR